jgi:hypothetical protein
VVSPMPKPFAGEPAPTRSCFVISYKASVLMP